MRDSEFVKIAKALADPTRHRILERIRAAGQLTCSEVCDTSPRSQPTISHHLKTLEKAGLIKVRKQGLFHVLTPNEKSIQGFTARLAPPTRARPRRARAAR